VLAIVPIEDLDIVQFDINTAFLYVDLNEEIYMCQLEGLVVLGSENKICLFHKSQYGLKQISEEWNKSFNNYLVSYILSPQVLILVCMLAKYGHISFVLYL
jgi:hypothetical protein